MPPPSQRAIELKCPQCGATIVYQPETVFALSTRNRPPQSRAVKSVYLTCDKNHTNLFFVRDVE